MTGIGEADDTLQCASYVPPRPMQVSPSSPRISSSFLPGNSGKPTEEEKEKARGGLGLGWATIRRVPQDQDGAEVRIALALPQSDSGVISQNLWNPIITYHANLQHHSRPSVPRAVRQLRPRAIQLLPPLHQQQQAPTISIILIPSRLNGRERVAATRIFLNTRVAMVGCTTTTKTPPPPQQRTLLQHQGGLIPITHRSVAGQPPQQTTTNNIIRRKINQREEATTSCNNHNRGGQDSNS